MDEKTIRIDPKQQQWLDAIIMDDDPQEALEFLKEVVLKQIKSQDPVICGPKTVAP